VNETTNKSTQVARIDHDRLFKELLIIFFREFIMLFLPQVAAYTDFSTLAPLDKEVFTDVTAGEKHEVDVLMQVKFKPGIEGYGEGAAFLVHVENQASSKANFNKRMFIYYSRLIEKFDIDIYPIALFSFDEPYRSEPHQYVVKFPNKTVLDYNFDPIQLNQLDWHDFLQRPNPVASALMTKMKIAPADRPKVKAQCVAMLVGLELDEAKNQLLTGFMNTYLDLNQDEEKVFQAELDTLVSPQKKEEIMDFVTTRDLRVMAEGQLKGRQEGETDLLLHLLNIKLSSSLPPDLVERIQALSEADLRRLGEALFNFNTVSDVTKWLDQN